MKKFLFILLLLLPWGCGWLYFNVYAGYQPECLSRFSFAYVDKQGDVHYSDGTFSFVTSLWGTGSGVYKGKLYHSSQIWPVHVSFTYDYRASQGIAKVYMRTVSAELGNQASMADIAKYISPVLKAGETHRTRFSLLEGKKIASGTSNFPRMVCTN